MSFEYDLYLKEHTQNVGKALRWMSDNIPEVIDQQAMSIAMENAMRHDDSKNSMDEYAPYDRYFYSGNRSYQVMKDFDRAWLHHIHNNPHHWQYWVLLEDDPKTGERFKALEMPKEYVYEMIADWWTFSWKQNKLDEIFGWYEDHEDKMILNSNTRKLVTDILNAIHIKLEELGKIEGEGVVGEVVEHADISDENEEDKNKYGIPELKKYPMPDIEHVRSAIRFFNYVDPEHEKELAEAILKRMEEYGLVLGEDISVGDENRFKKYLPKEKSEKQE